MLAKFPSILLSPVLTPVSRLSLGQGAVHIIVLRNTSCWETTLSLSASLNALIAANAPLVFIGLVDVLFYAVRQRTTVNELPHRFKIVTNL